MFGNASLKLPKMPKMLKLSGIERGFGALLTKPKWAFSCKLSVRL